MSGGHLALPDAKSTISCSAVWMSKVGCQWPHRVGFDECPAMRDSTLCLDGTTGAQIWTGYAILAHNLVKTGDPSRYSPRTQTCAP